MEKQTDRALCEFVSEWQEMESNKSYYEMHLFSLRRNTSSFLPKLLLDNLLFFLSFSSVFQQRVNRQISLFQKAAFEGIKSK